MKDCCISSSMRRGRIRSREFGAVMSIRTEGKAGPRYSRGRANILGMKTRRQPGGCCLTAEMPTSYGRPAVGARPACTGAEPSMKNGLVRAPDEEDGTQGPADYPGVKRHYDPPDRFTLSIEELVHFRLSVRCPHNHCCTLQADLPAAAKPRSQRIRRSSPAKGCLPARATLPGGALSRVQQPMTDASGAWWTTVN